MPSTTAAGTAIAISSTTPTTQDAAGYGALTYTEIGQVEKLGTLGATFAKVEFQPLKGPKQKHKGSADYGSLQPSMAFDDAASQRCGVSVAKPTETAWGTTFNTIGERSANVPIWWFLVHALSKGVTASATASIPCAPDIRQMRMEIDSSRIDNQVLLQEVADFTRDCYGYSRSRLFTNRPQLDKAQSHACHGRVVPCEYIHPPQRAAQLQSLFNFYIQ